MTWRNVIHLFLFVSHTSSSESILKQQPIMLIMEAPFMLDAPSASVDCGTLLYFSLDGPVHNSPIRGEM